MNNNELNDQVINSENNMNIQENYSNPQMNMTSPSNVSTNKKSPLKIILIILGGLFVIGAIFIIVTLFNFYRTYSPIAKVLDPYIKSRNSLVCTSKQGNIILYYDDSNISSYIATGLTYDLDGQQEIADQIGTKKYISKFNTWFKNNTTGYCKNIKR